MVGKYRTLQQSSLYLSYLTSCATFIVKNEILPTKEASALLKVWNTEERETYEKINFEESHDTINGPFHEVVQPQDLVLNQTAKTLVAAALQAAWKVSRETIKRTRRNREMHVMGWHFSSRETIFLTLCPWPRHSRQQTRVRNGTYLRTNTVVRLSVLAALKNGC